MLAADTGDRLERYRLEARLGPGALGAVYRAQDLRFERPVAVRVLDLPSAASDTDSERWLREARSAVRVRAPTLARVLECGLIGPHAYLVSEYLAGPRLDQVLAELRASGQKLDLAEALQTARTLCLAVAHLHQRNLLHLAVHPGNCHWRSEAVQPEDLSLADVGLAAWRAATSRTEADRWRTPEQAAGQAPDARTDVFALGLVVYELLAGELPFALGPGRFAQAVPSPRRLRPELPEPVEYVVARALELDPAERYPDAAALAVAVSALLPAGIRPGRLLGEAAARLLARSAAAEADADPVSAPAASAGPLRLHLITPQLAVVPGQTVEAVLVVGNPGFADEEYQLRSDGLPAAWSTSPAKPVRIAAGGQHEFRLKFHPPRAPASRAGRHLVRLRVSAASAPRAVAEARLILSVGAYSDVQAALRPRQLGPFQAGRVVIVNRGNTPAPVRVAWADPEDALRFQPEAVRLKLEPGENAAVEFQVTPRRPRWLGQARTRAYRVQVAGPDDQRRVLNGRVLVQARISAWISGALASGAALVLGSGLLMLFFIRQGAAQLRAEVAAPLALIEQAPAAFALTADSLSNVAELALGPDREAGGGLGAGAALEPRADPLSPAPGADGLSSGADPGRAPAPPALAVTAPTPTAPATPTDGPDPTAPPAAPPTQAADSADAAVTPPSSSSLDQPAPAAPTRTAQPSGDAVAADRAAADRGAAVTETSTVPASRLTVTLGFSPTLVADTESAQLIITLTNTSEAVLRGLGFTHDLAPLVIAGEPETDQCGGAVSANASRLTLTLGTLPPQGGCAIVVAVTAPSGDVYGLTFPSGAVSDAARRASSNAASAQLRVLARPVVAVAFSPDTLSAGLTATLTITLANPGPADLTGVTFSKRLEPFRLALSGDTGLTCPGGDLAAGPLQSTLGLSGGVIPAGGRCTLRVTVSAAQSGRVIFGPGEVVSSGGPNTNSAVATLTLK